MEKCQRLIAFLKSKGRKNYVSKAELNEKNTNFVLVNSMR